MSMSLRLASDPPDVISLLGGMSADGAAYATRCALGDFCASIGLGIAAVRHYSAASDSCSPSDTQALTKLGTCPVCDIVLRSTSVDA